MYGKKCFKMQPSSLSFLAENGFNFNKLYKDGNTCTIDFNNTNGKFILLHYYFLGIPYMRSKEEIVIREKLQEKYKTPENKLLKSDDFASRVPIPPDLAEKIENYW